MVFLHGWGGNRNSFIGLARNLSDKFRVTLPDLYGFGNTPHPDKGLFVDDYVDSIIELIKYYEMRNITLVCHSFGGRIGIKLCAEYPYLVEKLILTDSAGIIPKRGVVYYFKIFRHKFLTKLKINHKAGSTDYRSLSGAMRLTFKNVVNEDLSKYLEQIKQQTLIIWGNKDKDTPIYMAKKLFKKIKNSKLMIFYGCGHFAYVDRSVLFNIVTESFLTYGCVDLEWNLPFFFVKRNGIIKVPLPKSE